MCHDFSALRIRKYENFNIPYHNISHELARELGALKLLYSNFPIRKNDFFVVFEKNLMCLSREVGTQFFYLSLVGN